MPNSKPSSNWLALQKQMTTKKRRHKRPSKRPSHFSASAEPSTSNSVPSITQSKVILQQMVLGELEYPEAQKEPGKYLALDCEMVGVGIQGSESSLARVSLVNYHGAVLLDEFVSQKERVVDYRTQWSGVRPEDLVNGQPFAVVQKQVANLLKGKILVGHAVYNDLKVLLLSHPRPKTRDTQYYAHKFGVCKSGRVALRDLVKQELGLTIQSGEHSSVTDARATMAVYRLHQKAWEQGIPNLSQPSTSVSKKANTTNLKKKESVSSGGGKYGRKEQAQSEVEARTEWWRQLPSIAVDQRSVQTLDWDEDVECTNDWDEDVECTSVADWTQEWHDSD